jgi:UDP-3-O-[3-hydroxymyristoyl] N-acetylglucosamine deacetylase/3-hydroxyacyl-[acyl-carrier-protein] dehydratase
MEKYQKTVKDKVELTGRGLFHGEQSKVRLLPAGENSGITFVRIDIEGRPAVKLSPENLFYNFRRTAVRQGNLEIDTVEHLLSAIKGLGIDNILIEMEGREVPHFDGSSKVFTDEILKAGIKEQDERKKTIHLSEAVDASQADAQIIALPHPSFKITYTLSHPGTTVGNQYLACDISETIYRSEIAPARTYCFEEEVESFLQKGLGKGGDYQSVLVFGKKGVVDNKLRFSDEPVRHKILDLIGDLACLEGTPLLHIVAIKSGHILNLELVRRIAEKLEEKEEETRRPEALLGIQEILKTLPHRYPFLLIDKVIKMEGYERAIGIKNVTINEPFFQGHYPENPLMPGVLIVEAMAQLAGALLLRHPDVKRYTPVLLGIDDVRLRRSVSPGDQLLIDARATKIKARSAEIHATVTVDEKVVAEARLKFVLIEK